MTEKHDNAKGAPVERRVRQSVFEEAYCEKCGAYAPYETGETDEGTWWEQYCDKCDSSNGDIIA